MELYYYVIDNKGGGGFVTAHSKAEVYYRMQGMASYFGWGVPTYIIAILVIKPKTL